jgi:hypothetical protein
MDSMAMTENPVFKPLRLAYRADDFWSKTAKRHFRFVLLRQDFSWPQSFDQFLVEFDYIEKHKSSVVRRTGESVRLFICRLSHRLGLAKEINESELNMLVKGLAQQQQFSELAQGRAKVLPGLWRFLRPYAA